MKKGIILIFIVALLPISVFSQTIDGVNIADVSSEYGEIKGYQATSMSRIQIAVQLGENDAWEERSVVFKDKGGVIVEIESMTDALNFMDKCGYELIDACYTVGTKSKYYSYIIKLKRE